MKFTLHIILWAVILLGGTLGTALIPAKACAPPCSAPEEILCKPSVERAEESVKEHVIGRSLTVLDGRDVIGTGVLVSRGGVAYVLTCEHVVCDFGQRPCYLRYRSGKKIAGTIVWKDRGRDVALIVPASDYDNVPAALCPGVEAEPDDTAWFCGSGAGVEHNLARTHVSKVVKGKVYLGGGGGWYGHSGSGVFVKREGGFRLVGLVRGATEGHGKLLIAVGLDSILDSLKDYDASVKKCAQKGCRCCAP